MLNRLSGEKSPYLLQHAQNPVDWYPWGGEAFASAQKANRPIFLSIGYSTCHWCHVMARESFADPQIARLLNEAFVCIKVDREERPDVDASYMEVCQLMTGQRGWPLTIIMTPDKKPFFAATYIPKETRFGQIGMLELIPQIKELWEKKRAGLLAAAEEVTRLLSQPLHPAGNSERGEKLLKVAYEQLSNIFDERYGGFGEAPKFPLPHHLMFLLRYWRRTGGDKALAMVEQTLQRMRLGGIYDQVGFGFHRYATDRAWRLLHFEKMLYDQALISMAYMEAYQATAEPLYRETAQEILTYVLREMQDPAGGFYAAEDAESGGSEGGLYLWRFAELKDLLSPEEFDLVVTIFNIKKEGNIPAGPPGENILYLGRPLAEIAKGLAIPLAQLQSRLEGIRKKLLVARQQRPQPLKDDKVLADWNGLMIAALAKGAQVFDERRYEEGAKQAAEFLLTHMIDVKGRLFHRYRDGEAAIGGFLDDYAFFIWGLIELYETTFAPRYLERALELNSMMLQHFWDGNEGGLYFTAEDSEALLTRLKKIDDGAVPSGNAVAMLNLLRLSRFNANAQLEERAADLWRAFAGAVSQTPGAYSQWMIALDFAHGPSCEVVIVGDPGAEDTKAMVRRLRRAFLPNKAVIMRQPAGDPEITRLAGFTKDLSPIGNKATAYVCRGFRCGLPTTDADQMLREVGLAI